MNMTKMPSILTKKMTDEADDSTTMKETREPHPISLEIRRQASKECMLGPGVEEDEEVEEVEEGEESEEGEEDEEGEEAPVEAEGASSSAERYRTFSSEPKSTPLLAT